ncbi:Aspartyl/Asparaginyl beta-hydroxylase [Rhodococcus wratislaviensis IFP 2016]|nr:Aspartyl/Asparaginyl beta-hydroxylase [Rhodococcus wratislaviensis IFP 2016]
MSLENSGRPVPTTTVPLAAKLTPSFDVEKLQADLRSVSRHQWRRQRYFDDDGSVIEAEFDWRCLPLRSISGNPAGTDPGGPGLFDYQDTAWLAEAPYFKEVLASIPAELRSVRLLALGPGASSPSKSHPMRTSGDHNDTKYGPAWGTARLHIPVTTCAGARLFLENTLHQWQPGEFWFGDFSRMHRIENTGNARRVHMVIDALVCAELLDLFPASCLAGLNPDDVLINKKRVPADRDLHDYRVEFDIPLSFTSWEERDGEFLLPQELADASIDLQDGTLVLSVNDKPAMSLIHVGENEFRFAGWTDERTIEIVHTPLGIRVVLRTRVGSAIKKLDVAGRSL